MTQESIALEANKLVAANTNAALATIMVATDSTPFVSWVPYALANDGTIILLLSELAQHSKNIKENPNISLLITSSRVSTIPDLPRITLQAQLQSIQVDTDLAVRYLRYFPYAKDYLEKLDFSFYQVVPQRAQAIMGFAQAQWIKGKVIHPSPFADKDERHMIEHMNSDHTDAICHYCDKVPITITPGNIPQIVGITAYGFHVRVEDELHWFAFDTPCHDVKSVREVLVAMARS